MAHRRHRRVPLWASNSATPFARTIKNPVSLQENGVFSDPEPWLILLSKGSLPASRAPVQALLKRRRTGRRFGFVVEACYQAPHSKSRTTFKGWLFQVFEVAKGPLKWKNGAGSPVQQTTQPESKGSYGKTGQRKKAGQNHVGAQESKRPDRRRRAEEAKR
jgi:hypothetical protein